MNRKLEVLVAPVSGMNRAKALFTEQLDSASTSTAAPATRSASCR